MLSQVDVATPVVDALSESATKVQLALTELVLVLADGVVGTTGAELLPPPPPHATMVAAIKDIAKQRVLIIFILNSKLVWVC